MTQPGEIVRAFLLKPGSRSNFDPLFELCHSITVGFLRYCHSRGYHLPLHRADSQVAYSDLAITLMGELFRSEPGRAFAPIFDYFARHNVKNYQAVRDTELYHHFKTLVCGYIKKQLFRLRKTENSQAEILKRRIKDILHPPVYIRIESGYNEPTRVARAKDAAKLRKDAAAVSPDHLREMVENAYCESRSRAEWCEIFFELLNAQKELQNFVSLNNLLAMMVSVNADALQELLPYPRQPESPETEIVRRTVDVLVSQTVGWAEKNVIADFVLKGRIEAPEGRAYGRALENYLLDLGHCGDTDSIPQYFREVMPSDKYDCYLTRHKYPFETVISESLEYFRKKLEAETT